MTKNKLRPIAIYLPQYHPIPENDEWWGKGFTEWTNVTKAKPLFDGHYQPHLPADLGYYDLRVPEIREAQAKMAKENGIHGFCYYHYWFNGKRILERPFQEVFETGKPDFPFMLCWANENWTRTWDGLDKHILLEQNYSEEDTKIHIQSLLPYFKDPRYIRINNKPVFAIYKSHIIPNIKSTLNIWRKEARKEGIELYLCRFESFGNYGSEFMEPGFNASIDFQPFSKNLDDYKKFFLKVEINKNWYLKVKLKYFQFTKQHKKYSVGIDRFRQIISTKINYNDFVDFLIEKNKFETEYVNFPGATPSWDNTARKAKNAFYFNKSNPQKFEEWLAYIDKNYRPSFKDENLIFINAWNEWAEGNHLEPCQKWGMKYLHAVKKVFIK